MNSAGDEKLEAIFVREPTGAIYRCLLAVLGETAKRALVVERRDGPLREKGDALLERMCPWLRVAEKRGTWPGTTLLGGERLVYEYDLSTEMLSMLQGAVDGLYGWLHGMPEDLALLREDGETMLYSIAHEEEGAIFLLPGERDHLLRACPEIAEYVRGRD